MNCDFAETYDWPQAVADAWGLGESGEISAARRAYERVEHALPEGATLCPDLTVLRHTQGVGVGAVRCVPPTEDEVSSLFMISDMGEWETSEGLKRFEYTPESLEGGIRHFIERFDGGYFAENITEHRPHVFVMSTGRCGTVSLYHLFRGTNLEPYHTYWFQPSGVYGIEFLCKLVDRRWKDETSWRVWAKCRAAEWLGAKPMVGLNHMDTVFAPVFAALHPNAKFIHLRRNRMAVFRSFYTKNQYGTQNLMPVNYHIANDFKWRRAYSDEAQAIEWFINFTADFARTMGRVLGPERYTEIVSDKLFAQDETEIGRLLEFTGSDVPHDEAVAHFGTKINEKAHKAVR